MDWVATSPITPDPGQVPEIREKSLRAQALSRWTRLDRFDCDATMARMLALRCPVRRFTTDVLDHAALGYVQPRHLIIDSISLRFYEGASQHRTDETASVNASSVTHAILIVTVESQDYETRQGFPPFRREKSQ